MLETQFVEKIKRSFKRTEPEGTFFIIKIHGGWFQTLGLPDLLIFRKGFPVTAIEAKIYPRKATPKQLSVLRKLYSAGVTTCVATYNNKTKEEAWENVT